MDPRKAFHESLEQLEAELISMGSYARDMVARAGEAIATRDEDLARSVIAADDPLDERYLALEQEWLETMALQTPVAGDLRMMSVILHTAHSIERIGDQAVSAAAVVRDTHEFASHEGILAIVGEIVDRVGPMLDTALASLERRDLEMALSLPTMGQPVERLERSLYGMITQCSPEQLEWAVRIIVVARNLGRVAGRAVDVAEQVAFLLSGEFREFTSEDRDPEGLV